MIQQLPLNIGLRDSVSLANFFPGNNHELLDRLQALLTEQTRERTLFIWGESGSGKTHLLQGACRLADNVGKRGIYLPLEYKAEWAPGILEGLEENALICIDNIHCIAGEVFWEAALFGLYERLSAHAGLLLVSGIAAPLHSGFGMSELRSRLGGGLVYQLQGLSDSDKLTVLRNRAHSRGLELPEEVARYILQRYPRDMHALFGLLDRLDKDSLAAQRRLTIPLVRSLE